MASNTENLDLLMKNPSTDGADTFNVQTMLNENWQKIDNNAGTVAQTLANILKPTTPPIIGLPSSATPNDMFNALAHAGDLHVWRKTVVNSQAVAASYTLGEKANIRLASQSVSDGSGSATRVTVLVTGSISVSDSGVIIPGTTTEYFAYPDSISAGTLTNSAIAGKFIFVSAVGSNVQLEDVALRDIYYAPSDVTLSSQTVSPRRYLIASNLQKVIGHPYQPAGTTTTYPVSTNRNAYQEGNDAKPAGYTLGEVVTGTISVCPSTSSEAGWRYTSNQDSIVVSDAGEVSMSGNDTSMLYANSVSASPFDVLRGKYVKCPKINADLSDMIVYFPSDVVFSLEEGSPFRIIVNKYQPVTGYAAIPANTTIEYLGCLGDKARVQVVSYVGTGTYGSSNPNSLTFDFVPKAVFLFSADTYNKCFVAYGDTTGFVFDSDATVVLHVSWNGKNISWFNTDNDLRQHNVSGYKYRAIAIG